MPIGEMMSRKKISVQVMREVIKDLGGDFATKDVSEDIRMREAHPQLVKHSHCHAFVGGALSDHRAELDIKEIQKNTSRGSRWQKIGILLNKTLEHVQINEKNQGTHYERKINRTITLICPSCGGQLQTTKENDRFKCPHCANEHIIELYGEANSKQIVTSEIQSIQEEILDVKKSVNINNAELAIARINKELPLLRAELITLKKKTSSNKSTPNKIGGIGFLSIITGIIALYAGCLSVTIITFIIGIPLLIIGFALHRINDKEIGLLNERINILEAKKNKYMDILNKGGGY